MIFNPEQFIRLREFHNKILFTVQLFRQLVFENRSHKLNPLAVY